MTNRHRDQSLDVVFELEDRKFSDDFAVYEVNGPDIKAENDFGKTAVKTVQKESVAASGTTLKLTLPPHSFTMLKGSTT